MSGGRVTYEPVGAGRCAAGACRPVYPLAPRSRAGAALGAGHAHAGVEAWHQFASARPGRGFCGMACGRGAAACNPVVSPVSCHALVVDSQHFPPTKECTALCRRKAETAAVPPWYTTVALPVVHSVFGFAGAKRRAADPTSGTTGRAAARNDAVWLQVPRARTMLFRALGAPTRAPADWSARAAW